MDYNTAEYCACIAAVLVSQTGFHIIALVNKLVIHIYVVSL